MGCSPTPSPALMRGHRATQLARWEGGGEGSLFSFYSATVLHVLLHEPHLGSARLGVAEDQDITVGLQHAHCVWGEGGGRGGREGGREGGEGGREGEATSQHV